jgi:hypothetical protein
LLRGSSLPRDDDAAIEKAVLGVWKQLDDWVFTQQQAIKADAPKHHAQLLQEYKQHPDRYLTINV